MTIARRRRASHGYEDDMEYLEKPQEPTHVLEHSRGESQSDDGFGDTGGYRQGSPELTRPPEAHLYADNGTHYGQGYVVEADPGYYGHNAYAPGDYGVEYPPAAAYDGMPNPHGGQYEYTAEPAEQPSTPSAVPAALRPSVKHLSTPGLLSPNQVDPHHFSIDSFYGGIASPTASHGTAI